MQFETWNHHQIHSNHCTQKDELRPASHCQGSPHSSANYEIWCHIHKRWKVHCVEFWHIHGKEKAEKRWSLNKFSLLDSFFRGYTEDQRALLKKGKFLYSYVDSFIKLNDSTLPSLEKWKNTLKKYKVEITTRDLDHLKKSLVISTAIIWRDSINSTWPEMFFN